MNMMPLGAGGGMPQQPPMPSPEQIEQAQLIVDACSWEEISSILRSDDRRNYSVDIETDVTAFDDDAEEKQQRTEFMTAMTGWLQQAMPAIQGNPSMAPLFKELTMFFMGGFKVGRSLEETFEDAFDQIKNTPPQPDPEAEKIKGEMAMAKEKHAMEMQKSQADIAGKAQVAQMTAQGKQSDLAVKQQSAQMDMASQQQQMQMEQQKAQLEMQIELAKLQLERERMAMEREKMGMELQAAQQKAQIDQQSLVMQTEMQAEKSAIDMQTHREASDLKRDDMQFQSDFKREQAKKQAAAKPKGE